MYKWRFIYWSYGKLVRNLHSVSLTNVPQVSWYHMQELMHDECFCKCSSVQVYQLTFAYTYQKILVFSSNSIVEKKNLYLCVSFILHNCCSYVLMIYPIRDKNTLRSLLCVHLGAHLEIPTNHIKELRTCSHNSQSLIY